MTVFSTVFSQIPTVLQSLFSSHDAFHAVTAFTHGVSGAIFIAQEVRWVRLIAFLSAFTCIIPLIFGARHYTRLDKGSRLLTLNLLIVLCAEFISLILLLAHDSLGISTQIVYSIYTPIEFVLFILMFRSWHDATKIRGMLKASIPVFLLLWLAGQLWLAYGGNMIDRQLMLGQILLPVESLILIIVAIGTLVKSIRDETTPVVSSPVFWTTAAVLFYFTGNLFLFTFQSLILDENSSFQSAWYLHSSMNFVKYGLFTVALIIAGNRPARRPADREQSSAE